MNRTETLAAIAALPVSDAVKRHATRLVEGLPEWCNDPLVKKSPGRGIDLTWWSTVPTDDSNVNVRVTPDDCQLYMRYKSVPHDETLAFLRQLTGMVALTRGG